jgi:hypothetical protein
MPLIKNFNSTTIWKAFVLNSIASSITIVIAIILKSKFDKYYGKDNYKGISITFFITFLISFFCFLTMHIIFGYGKSMVSN